MHISRNGRATIKASRKTAHDKVFILGQKGHFSQKKWQHHQKNVINPKYVYCYQCFDV